jgi:hypothetical protein
LVGLALWGGLVVRVCDGDDDGERNLVRVIMRRVCYGYYGEDG